MFKTHFFKYYVIFLRSNEENWTIINGAFSHLEIDPVFVFL